MSGLNAVSKTEHCLISRLKLKGRPPKAIFSAGYFQNLAASTRALSEHTRGPKTTSHLGPPKSLKIHPLGTMHVCTKFHSNPSNNCRDISVCIKVVEQLIEIPSVILLAWLKMDTNQLRQMKSII